MSLSSAWRRRKFVGARRARLGASTPATAQDSPFVAEYYSAQLGRVFASSEAANDHYLSEGWMLGLAPNPFVDSERVRHDADSARSLYESVRALSAGEPAEPRWLAVREGLEWADLMRDQPEALAHPGGVPAFLCQSRSGRRLVKFQVGPDKSTFVPTGPQTLGWSAYRSWLIETIPLVTQILARNLFDQDYYETQSGLAFLSEPAALAHYLEYGEDAGFAPHPQFEPELYVAHAAGGLRNRVFLRHVAEGCEQSGNPSRIGAADARRIASDRARRFLADEEKRRPYEAPRTHHVTASAGLEDSPDVSVMVIVDARSLQNGRAEKSFESVIAQEHQSWTCRIVLPALGGDVSFEIAQRLVATDARVEAVRRQPDETYGEAVQRVLPGSDAVVFWSPAQTWEPHYLSRHTGALAEHPQASVAVNVGPARPHSWLTREDPVWLEPEPSAGVVIRTAAFGAESHFVDARLDVGIEQDVLLRLAADHVAVIVPGRSLRYRRELAAHERKQSRKIANQLRGKQILTGGDGPARVPGRVSLLIPTYEDWVMTERAVRAVLDSDEGIDLEVVIVDNGSRRSVSTILALAFGDDPRVQIHRLPVNGDFALGSNVALERSTGEYVVFLNNDTVPTPGWLRPLIDSLDTAAAAQPLLLYPDGAVQTAGTVFFGAVVPPVHLLAGHPVEDVHPALAEYDFNSLTAACLALRAEDARALGGFSLAYVNGMEDVDFCLRLRRATDRPLRLVPASVVHHHESRTPGRFQRASTNRETFVAQWRDDLVDRLDDRGALDRTHLRVAGATSRPASASRVRTAALVVARPERIVSSGEAAGLPSLRWAIKNPAPSGERGDLWGDTYFARALARALRSLGQEVVVDRLHTWIRPESDHLDDVTLTLRGLGRFAPQPDTHNLLWIISHPDAIDVAELRSGWDGVYAASVEWSATMTSASEREVRPLLQATDAERFVPDGPRLDSDVLFIGRTRGTRRPIVPDAIAAGADLAIYGDGWEEFVDPRWIRELHLANDEVPAAYRGARIVLNDHWPDMAAEGFWSNRVFDAVACGALVVSDEVAGPAGDFGPGVRTYRGVDDLERLLAPDASGWPTTEQRLEWSERIRREHSFTARARRLLADVLDLRGIEHHLS